MTGKRLPNLGLSLIVLFLLAGCDACEPTEIQAFEIILDGPPDGAMVNSHPTFSWHDEESCTPDQYQISITHETNDTYYGGADYPPGLADFYTWKGSLTPGTRYDWKMAAYVGPNLIGPYSEPRSISIRRPPSGSYRAPWQTDFFENG